MFFRNLRNILVVLAKIAILLAALGACITAILWPTFALGIGVHWAAGAAYGLTSFVLIVSALITLLQRAKSEQPVWDWLGLE